MSPVWKLGLLLLFVAFLPAARPAPERLKSESKVIEQPSAPVKILSYESAYQAGAGAYVREGIRHALDYQNISTKSTVAVQFGLVSFDVWNEFLDRTAGVDIETILPQAMSKGTWVASRYADFSFHTGVAYVSKVRFEDGQIWQADLDAILSELRKIESDVDAAHLKKRDESK